MLSQHIKCLAVRPLFHNHADMSKITLDTFVHAVAKYFEPIAKEHTWPLVHQTPNLYEITTPHFIMRIRFDVGAHTKSINATLIPANQMPGDIENGKGELGIGLIAGYNGMPIEYIPWDATESGFEEQAQHISNMVKQYALPYLLNQRSDWNEITEFLRKKNEQSMTEIKKYKFPQNVQKRWHLPKLKNDESHTKQ